MFHRFSYIVLFSFARLSRLDRGEIGYFSTNDMFKFRFPAPFSHPGAVSTLFRSFLPPDRKRCRAAILLRRREFTTTTNRLCTRSVYTYVHEP